MSIEISTKQDKIDDLREKVEAAIDAAYEAGALLDLIEVAARDAGTEKPPAHIFCSIALTTRMAGKLVGQALSALETTSMAVKP